jgi:hypothetical protein
MCNPHARARTAGTAGRGIDNPPSSKKTHKRELSFRPPQPGASTTHTMSFSSCTAALTLVGDDRGLLGCRWALWCARWAEG